MGEKLTPNIGSPISNEYRLVDSNTDANMEGNLDEYVHPYDIPFVLFSLKIEI